MSVQIIINGENATESLNELATLAAGFGASKATIVAEPEADKPKKPRSAPAKKEEPVKEPVQAVADQTEIVEAPSDDDAPVPTSAELRAKAREVGKTVEVKEAIRALLDTFPYKSISDVAEKDRAEFMRGLEEL